MRFRAEQDAEWWARRSRSDDAPTQAAVAIDALARAKALPNAVAIPRPRTPRRAASRLPVGPPASAGRAACRGCRDGAAPPPLAAGEHADRTPSPPSPRPPRPAVTPTSRSPSPSGNRVVQHSQSACNCEDAKEHHRPPSHRLHRQPPRHPPVHPRRVRRQYLSRRLPGRHRQRRHVAELGCVSFQHRRLQPCPPTRQAGLLGFKIYLLRHRRSSPSSAPAPAVTTASRRGHLDLPRHLSRSRPSSEDPLGGSRGPSP